MENSESTSEQNSNLENQQVDLRELVARQRNAIDVEPETNRLDPEDKKPLETLTRPSNRIFYRIAKEGVWKGLRPPGGGIGSSFKSLEERIIDFQRVIDIANEERALKPDQSSILPEYQLPHSQELTQTTQQNLHKFISSLTENHIVSDEVITLTEKMTQPEDVVVNPDHINAYNIDLSRDPDKFPQTAEERPKITLSEDIIKSYSDYFLEIAQKAGVTLTPEQAVQVSALSVAAHEWGHSLERAIQTAFMKSATSSVGYDETQHKYIARDLSSKILFTPANNIARPTFTDLRIRDIDKQSIHREKFATSFQVMSARYGLEQVGISPEDSSKVINLWLEAKSARTEDFQSLRETQAISDSDWHFMAVDVRDVLRNAGEKSSEDLIVNWDQWGYFDTYYEPEIRQIISQGMEAIKPENVRRVVFSQQPN